MIKLRYFPDFTDGPTLLVTGDSAGFRTLASAFEALGDCSCGVRRDLHDVFGGSTHLIAVVSDEDAGLAPAAQPDGKSFSWTVSPVTWKRFAELTRVIADSKDPRHQYLETKNDTAVMKISIGESFENLEPH